MIDVSSLTLLKGPGHGDCKRPVDCLGLRQGGGYHIID
jgi:hypothetical protein